MSSEEEGKEELESVKKELKSLIDDVDNVRLARRLRNMIRHANNNNNERNNNERNNTTTTTTTATNDTTASASSSSCRGVNDPGLHYAKEENIEEHPSSNDDERSIATTVVADESYDDKDTDELSLLNLFLAPPEWRPPPDFSFIGDEELVDEPYGDEVEPDTDELSLLNLFLAPPEWRPPPDFSFIGDEELVDEPYGDEVL